MDFIYFIDFIYFTDFNLIIKKISWCQLSVLTLVQDSFKKVTILSVRWKTMLFSNWLPMEELNNTEQRSFKEKNKLPLSGTKSSTSVSQKTLGAMQSLKSQSWMKMWPAMIHVLGERSTWNTVDFSYNKESLFLTT